MSKKGILVALSLSVAQIFLPAPKAAAMAQTRPTPTIVTQDTQISWMQDLAHKLDVAVGRAVVLGRYQKNGLGNTAAALGVPALDKNYVDGLLNLDNQLREDPELIKAQPQTIREIFGPTGEIRGSSGRERENVAMISTMLNAAIANDANLVAKYCSTAPKQDELCAIRPVLDMRERAERLSSEPQ